MYADRDEAPTAVSGGSGVQLLDQAPRGTQPPRLGRPQLGPERQIPRPRLRARLTSSTLARRLRHRPQRWWVRVLVAFVVSRLIMLPAVVAALLHSGSSLNHLLGQWDTTWYVSIAKHGYPHSASILAERPAIPLAFLPGFPALLKPALLVFRNSALAATVLGCLFGALSSLAVWQLAYHFSVARVGKQAADRLADRCVWLFCLFPGAFVLGLGYTEGLSIALSVVCLLALQRAKWLTAGLVAAVATATRPNALALVPVCAFAAGVAIRRRGEWRALVAPLLAPLGFVGFLVFLQVWTGSWRTWTIVERRYWQQSFDFSRQLADWLSPQYFAWHLADHDARYLTLVAGFIFLLAALHVFRAWRPPALLGWYVAGILAFCFLSSYVGPRPRMVLPAVPLFVALGDRYRGRRFVALAAVSSVGFGVMTYLAMTRAVVP